MEELVSSVTATVSYLETGVPMAVAFDTSSYSPCSLEPITWTLPQHKTKHRDTSQEDIYYLQLQ
jgi:hypothetical protein